MSDVLATALAFGFTMLVCLLAVHAILSPWLRVRRHQVAGIPASAQADSTGEPEGTPIPS